MSFFYPTPVHNQHNAKTLLHGNDGVEYEQGIHNLEMLLNEQN
jgi:hypothetical protein